MHTTPRSCGSPSARPPDGWRTLSGRRPSSGRRRRLHANFGLVDHASMLLGGRARVKGALVWTLGFVAGKYSEGQRQDPHARKPRKKERPPSRQDSSGRKVCERRPLRRQQQIPRRPQCCLARDDNARTGSGDAWVKRSQARLPLRLRSGQAGTVRRGGCPYDRRSKAKRTDTLRAAAAASGRASVCATKATAGPDRAGPRRIGQA